MSRKKRWIERIKSLLILLLTVSAAFLAWRTGLFQRLIPESLSPEAAEPTPGVSSYQAAAEPVSAAVTGVSGLVCGVCYDDDGIREVMREFRAVFVETLGSASDPVPVEGSVWREALDGPGVFLDYGMPISLNVLACWMGTTAGFAGEQHTDRLLFSLPDQERVDLYYLDEHGNAFFCETLALGSTLYSGINSFLPNGADYAMQIDMLEACDPYTLILQDPLCRLPPTFSGSSSALRAASRSRRTRSIWARRDGFAWRRTEACAIWRLKGSTWGRRRRKPIRSSFAGACFSGWPPYAGERESCSMPARRSKKTASRIVSNTA